MTCINIDTDCFVATGHKGRVNLANCITDNRISSSLLKNLRIFMSLCAGSDAKCGDCNDDVEWSQAGKGNSGLLEDLVNGECTVMRFEDTYNSACTSLIVMREISECPTFSRDSQASSQAQQMEAGITLHSELKKLLEDRKIVHANFECKQRAKTTIW